MIENEPPTKLSILVISFWRRMERCANASSPMLRRKTDELGNGAVIEQRLYQLIRLLKPVAKRSVEIEFLDSGVEVFAFTFG